MTKPTTPGLRCAHCIYALTRVERISLSDAIWKAPKAVTVFDGSAVCETHLKASLRTVVAAQSKFTAAVRAARGR